MKLLVRRVLRPLLVAVVVLFALAYFVFPTRTWQEQRSTLAETNEQIAMVETENAQLESRLAAMSDADEIERLARQDFSLVQPGEDAYAILPPPPEPVSLPNAWPFTVLADSVSF